MGGRRRLDDSSFSWGADVGAAARVGGEAEGDAAADSLREWSGGPAHSPPNGIQPMRARLTYGKRVGSRRVWKSWNRETGASVEEVDLDKVDPFASYPAGDPAMPDAGVFNNQAAELMSAESSLKNGNDAAGGSSGGVNGLNGSAKNSKSAKKRNQFHLAVNPPKPHTVMRINSATSRTNPGAHYRQDLSRRALLRDAELTTRDLRRIDPQLLQTNNTPALLVSDQTIIMNLGVRVIIRPEHALLFEPDTATAKRFMETVKTRDSVNKAARNSETGEACPADRSLAHFEEQRMQLEVGHELQLEGPSCPLEAEKRAYFESSMDYGYSMDMDDKTPGGTGGTPIPFELEVVEAVLQETISQLYAKLEYCEGRCKQVSERLQSSINPAVLEELRLTKQSLVELDSRAGAIRQVLLDTLDDEDDIMNLTISSTAEIGSEEKEDEEEEVENLIEYYLQQTETVHSTAEQLLENMRDLEESITVSLSSRRYEVSKLELTLSIATFAAAMGALVTGIFGMNLQSTFEMSVKAFYLCTFAIVSGIAGIFNAIMKFARKQKIL